MLKQELLDYAAELRVTANQVEKLIYSFTESGFDWVNVTETQLAILQELYPLRNFEPTLDLKQDVSMRELSKIAGVK